MTGLARPLSAAVVSALALFTLAAAADAETARRPRAADPWREAAKSRMADEATPPAAADAPGVTVTPAVATSVGAAATPAAATLTQLPKAPEPRTPERAVPASTPSVGADGWKLLVGSVVLVVLLLLAPRFVKRLPLARLLPGTEGPIRVVARTHLGAKERLCLIEVGSTSILLALTPQGIRPLHVWPQGVNPVPGAAAPPADRRGGADGPGIPGQLRSLASRLGAGRA